MKKTLLAIVLFVLCSASSVVFAASPPDVRLMEGKWRFNADATVEQFYTSGNLQEYRKKMRGNLKKAFGAMTVDIHSVDSQTIRISFSGMHPDAVKFIPKGFTDGAKVIKLEWSERTEGFEVYSSDDSSSSGHFVGLRGGRLAWQNGHLEYAWVFDKVK
jgi:hypothetical protein